MCMKANFLETENNIAMKTNKLEYSKMAIDRLEEALELITDVYNNYNTNLSITSATPSSLFESVT